MIDLPHSANGTRKPHRLAEPPKRTKQRKARLKLASPVRVSALFLAAVGVALLGLSLTHCTEAISLLTGSHWFLSGLLALGIDAGMVGAEWAALNTTNKDTEKWAHGYVIAAVLLSMLLNCYAFGLHAAEGMQWASWVLGVFVPAAVYTLGRVAGKQWLQRS